MQNCLEIGLEGLVKLKSKVKLVLKNFCPQYLSFLFSSNAGILYFVLLVAWSIFHGMILF